ncbi:MAG: tetratricopeptide repeat protein [Candidatus Kapabacteria bacterium]|nr:tetratricopeptide repeat protein [Candidatus Kapabacteria bacterium]
MTHEELLSLLSQAEEHTNTGNYGEAERLANKVLAELDKIPSVGEGRGKDLLPVVGEYRDEDLGEETLNKNATLRACATRILGVIAWQRGNFTTSLEFYNDALKICEETHDRKGIAKTLGNIGNVHRNLSDYPRALEYLGKALALDEELGNKAGVAIHFGSIGIVHAEISDYPRALEYMGVALALDEELGNKVGVANQLGNIGNVHWYLADYARALEYLEKALVLNEELGNKAGVAIHLGNIGLVYSDLSDSPRALEYYGKALAIAEELGNKQGMVNQLGNIGNVHSNLSDYELALEYYGKVLVLAEELSNKAGVVVCLSNIGNVHFSLSEYPLALEYYAKALVLDEELGNKRGVAINLGNIGRTYTKQDFDGCDPVKAEEYLLRAINLSTEIGDKAALIGLHKTVSDLYEQEERLGDAFTHYKKYIEIEKEVNVEEVKKQEAIREQQKEIELAKAAADAKHQATQELLHNVLPPSIAYRMINGEKLIAEKLPSVSVLFADIVGFTKLSQRISAEELVEGLDKIFSTFDTLAERYGLEKIKTIGDAYMVVAGAPEPRSDHAEAMAYFALDMVEVMKEFASKTTGDTIQLRIGIHSGEVVAGVIGKKKFAYDLWGDAVNTASRMESYSEAGRIHVSEEFVRTLFPFQTLPEMEGFSVPDESFTLSIGEGRGEDMIRFIPRGEMEIKGKGMMKTYFFERTS